MKYLSDDGVELFFELLHHFQRRWAIHVAASKAVYVINTFYGDVAYEQSS